MSAQDRRQKPVKGAQRENADKAALEVKPDEGRMGALAKRLLETASVRRREPASKKI